MLDGFASPSEITGCDLGGGANTSFSNEAGKKTIREKAYNNAYGSAKSKALSAGKCLEEAKGLAKAAGRLAVAALDR
jgi:hypothetical protein